MPECNVTVTMPIEEYQRLKDAKNQAESIVVNEIISEVELMLLRFYHQYNYFAQLDADFGKIKNKYVGG